MSWFNRAPRKNEPPKPHVYHPPRPTPATECKLEESKDLAPLKKNKSVKKL